jgi:hypothetical protein
LFVISEVDTNVFQDKIVFYPNSNKSHINEFK